MTHMMKKPVHEESEGCESGEEPTYDCTGTRVYETLWGFTPSTSHGTRRPVIKRIWD